MDLTNDRTRGILMLYTSAQCVREDVRARFSLGAISRTRERPLVVIAGRPRSPRAPPAQLWCVCSPFMLSLSSRVVFADRGCVTMRGAASFALAIPAACAQHAP